MYKKLLLSLVLMAIGFTTSSYAQNNLTVYDGGATNAYVPVYGFYADAFTKVEFIMNSDELSPMTGGQITSMKWYLSTPAADVWGGRFQIFVQEVDFNALEAYVGMGNATIVYDGPLDGTQEELEIQFDTPFEYNGGNLLVGVYGVEKGTYKSATFSGAEVMGASLQGYSYSDLEAVTPNQRNFVPKTTFTFLPSSGVVYFRPTNVQASNITSTSADITWTPGNDETSWNVEYKKQSEEAWTDAGSVSVPTITLDVLQNGTPYNVRVQADYGDGNLSGWTNATFNTQVCEAEDMGEVTYILTDSYGDGWNGNKLQIVYHPTGIVVAEVTIPAGENYQEGKISLCYGEEYDVVWVLGSYPGETGAQLIAPDGDIIYEHVANNAPSAGVLTTFTISRVTCPRPTDLVASDIVYNGATLSWTPGAEDQDLWHVVYGVGEFNPSDLEPVIVNGDPTVQLNGLEENTTYTAYVRSACTPEDMSIWSKPCTFTTPLRFPIPTDLAVGKITAKSAEATWNGDAEAYNLRYREKTNLNESFEDEATTMQMVDNDGDGNNWKILKITDWTMGGTPLVAADGDYCIVSESITTSGASNVVGDNWLISPRSNLGGKLSVSAADLGADYVENFSVLVSNTDANPESFTEVGTGTTAGVLNQWGTYEFDLSAYAGQQGYIAIRHQPNGTTGYILMIDAVSIAGEGVNEADWIVLENVTSPVTMEPLAPGTTYEVQVQSVYGEDVSAWTAAVNFITLPADAIPSDLEVVDVTPTTAQVTWAGSQDAYNLRYRKAAVMNGIVEDFTGYETGDLPDGWTVIDADGDGQNWYIWNLTLDDGTVQTTLSSNSYINNYGPVTPDNWVITPNIKLGANVNFDAWGQDPSYAAEHFQVYVSVTGTEIGDFIPVSDEIVATGAQTNYNFEIGEFAGQMGYIAIRHFNVTDQYILNVSNFYMAGEEADVPAGEWIVIENVNPPYTIQGLEPETAYEVEVQGIYDRATTAWTAPVLFVTPKAGEQPTEKTQTPDGSYQVVSGQHEVVVTITPYEGVVYYRIIFTDPDGNVTESDWMEYVDAFSVYEDGRYRIEFYAVADGKLPSDPGAVEFTVSPMTGIEEMTTGKTVANVRYFNAAGQEMSQPNGLTIVVTTYTDGTTNAAKVMK